MRKRATLWVSALIILGALFTLGSLTAYCQVPDSINYSGILTSGGSPVPDGPYSVTFKIYDVATGPNPALWTETKSVTTSGGLFTTSLGSVTPLPHTVFSGPNRFLGIAVDPDPEMTPRTAIVAVAYAYRIATVDGATGGSISGNLNLDPSTSISGNITKGGMPFLHNFGAENTFVGLNAGNLTMSGIYNSASGTSALRSNVSGTGNTAAGASALFSNTTGNENTALGISSLFSNSTGRFNTACGSSSLAFNVTGIENAAYGYGALYRNTTGSGNTASGAYALLENTVADSNTASGVNALRSNTNGYDNTAMGVGALLSNDSGGANTANGAFALVNNTTGNGNTASGGDALKGNTTGHFNTAIGYAANVSAGALTNATAIGSGAIVSVSNGMKFGNTSVVSWGFGVTPAAGRCLQVGTGVTNGNGAYLTTGGVWTNTSDRNLKEGITPVDGFDLLEKVGRLPVYRWNYKGEEPCRQHVGPMAQDFHAVFGIGDDDTHISTIDPAGIALASIQALNEKLNSQLNAQEAENDYLRRRIAELRKMILAQATMQK